jgi:hypothetical protein
MKKNIGILDKVARILAAAVILALYFFSVISGLLAMLLLVIAAGLLLTGLASFFNCFFRQGYGPGNS